MHTKRYTGQCGVAIGPVLFIVAVLAILAAAIAAGSGSFTAATTTESISTAASTIISYADLVGAAVQRLSIEHNCSASQINFVNPLVSGYTNAGAPSDNSCNVFDPAGGAITYQNPPASYLDSSNTSAPSYGNWFFSGANQLQNWNASSGSIILFLPYVPLAICQKINSLLGFPVTTQSYVPWINSVDTVENIKFTGASPADAYIFPNSGGCTSACYGVVSGCLWFNNWSYNTTNIMATGIFYKVLMQE